MSSIRHSLTFCEGMRAHSVADLASAMKRFAVESSRRTSSTDTVQPQSSITAESLASSGKHVAKPDVRVLTARAILRCAEIRAVQNPSGIQRRASLRRGTRLAGSTRGSGCATAPSDTDSCSVSMMFASIAPICTHSSFSRIHDLPTPNGTSDSSGSWGARIGATPDPRSRCPGTGILLVDFLLVNSAGLNRPLGRKYTLSPSSISSIPDAMRAISQ
mmetsp:Transcript_28250/g.81280  ORF Transcript_28250/g.81280 Transcript_28250/m.81280 type:complete len:217 (-) Transcript_28250:47-697(-)